MNTHFQNKYLKKVIALFTLMFFVFSAFSFSAFAQEADTIVHFDDSSVMTDALLLYDADTEEILYSKNSEKVCSVASLTKIMTCILALENIKEPQSYMIEITQAPIDDVSDIGASTAGFENYVGETFTALDILYGMMVPSGCEAAQILAYEIGKDPQTFTSMMNEKAKELGCENTTYIDAHGVDDGNTSTASDLLKITQYALSFDLFREIVSTQYYQVDGMAAPFFNTNYLIAEENDCGYYHKYVTGIKTGYTSVADKCLISSATKGNDDFICIALGGTYSANDNYINHAMTDTAALYDWALDNFTENIEVDIDKNVVSVDVSQQVKLNALIKTNSTDAAPVVQWSSSDENVATVDQNGVVYGKSLGQAKITAKTQTGNFDKVTVSVGFYNGIDRTSRDGDYTSGSKEQIDFKNLKNHGFDFAIIRAGWGSEDYPHQNDAQFVHNVTSASENDMPFYLSFVAYAQSVEEAYAEADYFLREMKDYFPQQCSDDLISVVYNMTYSPYSTNSKALNTEIAIAFANKLKENGYGTLIFASKAVYNNLDVEVLTQNNVGTYYRYYPYVSDFNNKITLPDGTTPDIWQYRSDGYYPHASENGYAKLCIAYMPKEQYHKYDVDRDGEVTVLDATLIQRVVAHLAYIEGFETYGDVDGNGKVNIIDATIVQLYLAKYE